MVIFFCYIYMSEILSDIVADSGLNQTRLPRTREKHEDSALDRFRGRVAALAAAAIVGTAGTAHAEQAEVEHDAKTKHAINVGGEVMLNKHPASGFEATYSILPKFDHSKRVNFVITPLDFMAVQKHLIVDGESGESIATRPQFFAGARAGLNIRITNHLELESEAGGGMAFVPYFHLENGAVGALKYQLAPVAKLDVRLVYFPVHHFNVFAGYSPETTLTAVPHKIKGDEVEKSHHFSHGISFGMGAEF